MTDQSKALELADWLINSQVGRVFNPDGEKMAEAYKALHDEREALKHDNTELVRINSELSTELQRVKADGENLKKLINTPIVDDFIKALPLEAAHQQYKWGNEHDSGKNCLDWFWLIGYLSQKIVMNEMAGKHDKALHHCITCAAAMMNWHRHLLGDGDIRPGIEDPELTHKPEPREG